MYKEFDQQEGQRLEQLMVQGLINEFKKAGRNQPPKLVVILDDDILNKRYYPNHVRVAELMIEAGTQTEILSPEDLTTEDGYLCFKG
jgi:hypothetical protein